MADDFPARILYLGIEVESLRAAAMVRDNPFKGLGVNRAHTRITVRFSRSPALLLAR